MPENNASDSVAAKAHGRMMNPRQGDAMIGLMAQPSQPMATRSTSVTAEGESYASGALQFTDVDVPETGQAVAIADSVHWCRIPLPQVLQVERITLAIRIKSCASVRLRIMGLKDRKVSTFST